MLCEGEGARPGTAADICCSFLLRETQPGANPSPSPAWVLPTPWPPAGRGCGHHGAQRWGFWGADAHRVGQQLVWIPLSACCGHHLFLSEPFSEAALSGKSHAVTVSPLSLIIQLSTPAPSLSPIPTEQKHADYYFFSPPKIWGTSHFCLPGSSIYLSFRRRGGEREELDVPTPPSASATPNPSASPAFHTTSPRAKRRKQTRSILQEKRNGYLPLGLARPGRWLVGGRHGPRSLHPPHGEGITEPLVSHVTAARHLTVHLVAL